MPTPLDVPGAPATADPIDQPEHGLRRAGRYLAQSFRLMVGLPDYDTYLSHMERTHPDQPAMDYEAFFRERLEARYGGGQGRMGRCC